MATTGVDGNHGGIVNGGLDNGLENANQLNSNPERIKFAYDNSKSIMMLIKLTSIKILGPQRVGRSRHLQNSTKHKLEPGCEHQIRSNS